ncbi:MAG: putative bifunctional diguanylate cyclase/phosphodiesterase [Proteocatella sp.]
MTLKSNKNIVLCYTLGGVLFGICFPFGAILFETITHNQSFTLDTINYVHSHNKLLFVIDTAPIFLGIFAYLIGLNSAKLHKLNSELEIQSYKDELTSLHNRRYLNYKFKNYVSNFTKDSKIGVFLLDLNRFKNINDSLGHSFGDKLLQAISLRLIESFGTYENLVRLGGDEFLILVPEMNDAEKFETAKKKILHAFATPFLIEDHILSISSSIGVSIYPNDGEDIEILLKKSDIAMYNCKVKSHCQCMMYKDYMSGEFNDIFSIENCLKQSVENNELYLLYQPIFDAISNKPVGVEALLRWNSKKLGLIPPDRFIPIAEENGYILKIGKYVLKEACKQGKLFHDRGMLIYVSVNISVEQLKDLDFISDLKLILTESMFNPKFLNLEITENISISSVLNIENIFKTIKSLDIQISLDDFGTGYSSFAQLKRLNVDTLKIDKSFIDNIHINISDASIASAMIKLAQNLGLKTVAEGVETKEQLDLLVSEDCTNIQGYFFSKPIPADQVYDLFYNNL